MQRRQNKSYKLHPIAYTNAIERFGASRAFPFARIAIVATVVLAVLAW